MARHNEVILYAKVIREPVISFDENTGERKYGDIDLAVYRESSKKPRFDIPVSIRTQEPWLVEAMEPLKPNDIVLCKGFLATMETLKRAICPYCGTKHKIQGNLVYIAPIFLEKVCSFEDDEASCEELVIDHHRFCNRVMLIGSLCRAPRYYETQRHTLLAEYQLAVDRKFRVRQDPVEKKTDFPWIKSSGSIAEEDAEHLQKGTEILVDGELQARRLEGKDARKASCLKCGKEFTFTDTVLEVVARDVRYLKRTIDEEEEEEDEEKEYEEENEDEEDPISA